MNDTPNLYEGLQNNDKWILFFATLLVGWARTFYGDAAFRKSDDPGTLSHVGAIASCYRAVYRQFLAQCGFKPGQDTEACAKLDRIFAYAKKKGSHRLDFYKRVRLDQDLFDWQEVNAWTMHSDIMRVYAEYRQHYLTKHDPRNPNRGPLRAATPLLRNLPSEA